MKKILNKIKLYRPAKEILLLYFFIPIFLSATVVLTQEEDIWFLLNHGKYILNHGFPTVEPFTIHQGLSFVMQQWLSAFVFYLIYSLFGKYGLLILIVMVNLLILFFLYKLCMTISDNKRTISTVITCITDIFLMIFILPRPQIFTYLFLIIILYIMEVFYKDKNTKLIYFLPLISILQINFHASMWFMLYLFMLPYIVDFTLKFIKNKKDKRIFKLLVIILVMLGVGFINPYGINNIIYIFNSYGNKYINSMIMEMFPPTINSSNAFGIYGKITFLIIGVIVCIYMFYRKGCFKLRHMLLLLGVLILALCNIRSLSLLIIGGIPFLAAYLKDLIADNCDNNMISQKYKMNYLFSLGFLFLFIVVLGGLLQPKFDNGLKKGVDKLLADSDYKDIVLYTNYNNGSYCEYRGIKTYIDTRAEVFLKSNNKKEDIFYEYYLLTKGRYDIDKFLNKYNFTHLLVTKNDILYKYLINSKDYETIYKEKDYRIFKRI